MSFGKGEEAHLLGDGDSLPSLLVPLELVLQLAEASLKLRLPKRRRLVKLNALLLWSRCKLEDVGLLDLEELRVEVALELLDRQEDLLRLPDGRSGQPDLRSIQVSTMTLEMSDRERSARMRGRDEFPSCCFLRW